MHPALWVSKTGLDAQQTNIATISNNLANASTVGYKKAVRSLKICSIKTSTSRVVSLLKTPSCQVA